jgi:hypothetical protein
MHDITEILAFEVKKEMADRYFGFRKRIEDDTIAYSEKLAISSLELENEIGFALIRIYILLGNETLISSFLNLVGLPRDFFYDRYILESPTIRKRVFTGLSYRGLTWKRGFKNMFYDTYDSLVEHIDKYRQTVAELTEEQETIREQINLFYRKNDIDGIMNFIRRLDNPEPGILSTMQSAGNGNPDQSLSGQMRLHPPLPACEVLPSIPALPSQKTIRRELKQLLKAAMEGQTDLDIKALTRAES